MSFKFGFSGDDIEEDGDSEGLNIEDGDVDMDDAAASSSGNVPVVEHDVLEMLQTLPSQISYITSSISSSPTATPILIPRRALFDVRMQIMAESDADDADTISSGNQTVKPNQTAHRENQIGLGFSDLEKDVYEGGFKVWEGAVDLARLLHSTHTCADPDASSISLPSDVDSVIELGAGAALPSLTVLSAHLSQLHAPSKLPSQAADGPRTPGRKTLHLTLTDYNALVLRLVTLPNLLLQYALHFSPESFDPYPPSFSPPSPSSPSSSAAPTPAAKSSTARCSLANLEGDLTISPTLLQSFAAFISAPNAPIYVRLVSGPWSPAFSSVLVDGRGTSRDENGNGNGNETGNETGDETGTGYRSGNKTADRLKTTTLILAAETLYSPSSTASFTRTLIDLLHADGDEHNTTASALALVAAKKVYFGVGGSVADFVALVEREREKERGVRVVDVSSLVPGLGLGLGSGGDGGGGSVDGSVGVNSGGGGGVGRCVLRVEVTGVV